MNQPPPLFLIGIGGMGMAPLALFLRRRGCAVSGYDDALRSPVQAILEASGITIHPSPELPAEPCRVVRSSAIAPDHPLVVQARERGWPVLRRGEMLAEVARDYRLVAVAGSHGKTTTTAMLVAAAQATGFPVNYILGGLFAGPTLPAGVAESAWLVAEVDESDGTIDGFDPEIAAIVNLDWDHADYYRSQESIEAAFGRLLARTSGHILIPQGDPALLALAEKSPVPTHTVGVDGQFSCRIARRQRDRMHLALGGRFSLPEAEVRAHGAFNAANAALALATLQIMGAAWSASALAEFPGVWRRQTRLLQTEAMTVLQDYAHHPAEVEALLHFAREHFAGNEIVTIFQPHRYSRTRQFAVRFAEVLGTSSRLALLPVYAASEEPLADGGSEAIRQRLPEGCQARLIENRSELTAWIQSVEGARKAVLFIGAGDIEDWAAGFVQDWQTSAHSQAASADGPRPPAKTWWDHISARLAPSTCLREHESLARKTTFGVGGDARYYAEPLSVEDLSRLYRAARQAGLPVFFLGRGSNLLVADKGFDGLVIRLASEFWTEIKFLDETSCWAGAGVKLKQLCARTAQAGLGGFEFLEGIPGTVGGSLRMNAGAMGGWIFDVVESVECLDKLGDRWFLPRENFHPDYRTCPELENLIVLGAVFRAESKKTPEEIRQHMESLATRRKSMQPREPSAGCAFKNPPGDHAGRIIDQLGLKGRRIGDAEVSLVHGNFLINRGQATCRDVVALLREIRQTVQRERGILLEPEIMLLGQTWEEALAE